MQLTARPVNWGNCPIVETRGENYAWEQAKGNSMMHLIGA